MFNFSLNDVGGLFTSIREAIMGNKIKDPEKVLIELNKLQTEFLNAQSSIIKAESNSEHWVVAAWRPITMLIFVFIIANNYIIVPYAQAMGADFPTLDIPPDLWALLKIGLGGYVVGRSVEKSVKTFKGL